MMLRMSAALTALAGVFISAYLWLYKLGKIGTLTCGTGGCETVQLSPYSRFLGLEVAAIGAVGYALLLALSLASLNARPAVAARMTRSCRRGCLRYGDSCSHYIVTRNRISGTK